MYGISLIDSNGEYRTYGRHHGNSIGLRQCIIDGYRRQHVCMEWRQRYYLGSEHVYIKWNLLGYSHSSERLHSFYFAVSNSEHRTNGSDQSKFRNTYLFNDLD